MIDKKLIELYADGLNLNEFGKDYGVEIDGYTFNPSIFKKNGAGQISCSVEESYVKKLLGYFKARV